MQRYGGAIEYILRLPLSIGADIIKECFEQKEEEVLLGMYQHLLPHMENKITFDEYKAQCHHKEFESTATNEELLEMAAQIERMKGGS